MTPFAGETIDGADANSKIVSVQEGESCDVTAALKNGDDDIAKAALVTVTATLYLEADGTVINSRNDQDILDANGGLITDEGVLTLRLEPDDNVLVGHPAVTVDAHETHILRIEWTWDDAVAASPRTGKQQIRLYVQQLQDVS